MRRTIAIAGAILFALCVPVVQAQDEGSYEYYHDCSDYYPHFNEHENCSVEENPDPGFMGSCTSHLSIGGRTVWSADVTCGSLILGCDVTSNFRCGTRYVTVSRLPCALDRMEVSVAGAVCADRDTGAARGCICDSGLLLGPDCP